jgi:hypothetical protein
MPEFFDAGMVSIIDARVKRALSRPQRVGTFVERVDDVNAMLVEDGTTTAMPCLVGSDVVVSPGDRVVFAQFGSGWVILTSLTPQGIELQYEYQAAGETVTSSSFVDGPGLPAVAQRTWMKRRPGTHVIVRVDASAFFAVTPNTDLQFGVLLTDLNTGTTYGPTFVCKLYSGDGNRVPVSRQVKIANVPVGIYDVKLQWRRAAGTGTPTMNADDFYSLNIREATLQG